VAEKGKEAYHIHKQKGGKLEFKYEETQDNILTNYHA